MNVGRSSVQKYGARHLEDLTEFFDQVSGKGLLTTDKTAHVALVNAQKAGQRTLANVLLFKQEVRA